MAFGHSADSALDFRCHLKQLADIGRALRQKYSLESLLSWFGDSICTMANCLDVPKEVVFALKLALPWQAFAEPSVRSGYMGGYSTGCTQTIYSYLFRT